jgi:hypothetical protein
MRSQGTGRPKFHRERLTMNMHKVHTYLNTHVRTLETPESRSWWAKEEYTIDTYEVWDNIAKGYVWIRRLWLVLGDLRQMQFRANLPSRYQPCSAAKRVSCAWYVMGWLNTHRTTHVATGWPHFHVERLTRGAYHDDKNSHIASPQTHDAEGWKRLSRSKHRMYVTLWWKG